MSTELKGVELFINDLRTTKLKFTKGMLHREEPEGCSYCGEGVGFYAAGVDKNLTLDRASFMGAMDHEAVKNDIDPFETSAYKKTFERYGFYFAKGYDNWRIVSCNLENRRREGWLCEAKLGSFEEVVTHMNDAHSQSHPETAEHIEDLNKIYNLETGELRTT